MREAIAAVVWSTHGTIGGRDDAIPRLHGGLYLTAGYLLTLVLGNIAIRRIQKTPGWAAGLTMTAAFVLTVFLESFILR